ncbi:hypothetical protein HK096_008467 [Nowakowskiella sp. JEL0078]|nr:hypothetical protein HK096_008467 [Nowakowskiella sp. JEL0078]
MYLSPANSVDTAPKHRRKKKIQPGESAGPTEEEAGLDAKWSDEMSETGNKKAPSYPGYWDVLVQYFGDKEGISHKRLADDNSSGENDSNNSMEESMEPFYNPSLSKYSKKRLWSESSHTILSNAEGSSTSIADGLLKLGESLKEAVTNKAGSSKAAVDEKRMKEILEQGVVKSLSVFIERLDGLVAAIENESQQTLQLKETIENGSQQTLQLKETIEKENEKSLDIQHQMLQALLNKN